MKKFFLLSAVLVATAVSAISFAEASEPLKRPRSNVVMGPLPVVSHPKDAKAESVKAEPSPIAGRTRSGPAWLPPKLEPAKAPQSEQAPADVQRSRSNVVRGILPPVAIPAKEMVEINPRISTYTNFIKADIPYIGGKNIKIKILSFDGQAKEITLEPTESHKINILHENIEQVFDMTRVEHGQAALKGNLMIKVGIDGKPQGERTCHRRDELTVLKSINDAGKKLSAVRIYVVTEPVYDRSRHQYQTAVVIKDCLVTVRYE